MELFLLVHGGRMGSRAVVGDRGGVMGRARARAVSSYRGGGIV